MKSEEKKNKCETKNKPFAACDTAKQVIAEPTITEVEPEIEEVHPPQVVEIVKPLTPEWHKNATIYEVNLRQFTEEATFQAFEAHIPRLKEMGIDILWTNYYLKKRTGYGISSLGIFCIL